MAIKYLNDIDLAQNELKNAKIQNLGVAPSNPEVGQIFFNSAIDKLQVYTAEDGWQNLGAGDPYVLPVATENVLGGILAGEDIEIDSDGHVSVKDNSHNHTISNVTGLQDALDDKVDANAAITGATHTKITYDAKGLVTAGSDLVINDIPALPLSKISDVTATAAEVNVLDGITATTAELNYVDGVTSSIQDQLDDKVEKNEAITGATHTKITYDAKGLVTGGTDLVATDIPDLTLAKISDVTATATEVNVLDGITATTTELNYVDGVTSSIQDQLDDKVEKNEDITAGTYAKITFDAKGLVTGGANLVASDIPDLSASYVGVGQKGVANGVATLDSNGLVPSTQLPSYVDDVIEVSTYSALPAQGETGKIYVTLDTNKCYRWGGSAYVEISQAEIHKFVGTITGNATNSSFTISHSLGTKDVLVNIYDVATGDQIMTDIERTSVSAITVIFAKPVPTGTSYKVVIVA